MSLLIDLAHAAGERSGRRRVLVYCVGAGTLDELEAYGAMDLDGELDGIPRAEEGAAEILVLARTATDLRRAASLQALLAAAPRVVVAVAETPSWYTAPVLSPTPAHRWRSLVELRVHQPEPAAWVVEARFSKPAPAGRTLAATVRAFAGHRMDAVAAPVAGLAGPGAAHWRPGDPNTAPSPLTGPVPDRFGARGADLVVRAVGEEPPPWPEGTTPVDRPVAELMSWERLGRPGGGELLLTGLGDLSEPRAIPPVDDRSVNPMGFVTVPSLGSADLSVESGRWTITCEGRALTTFDASGAVTDVDVNRIRQVRGVRVDWRRGHSGPAAALRVVTGLAAAGYRWSPRPYRTGRAPSAPGWPL